MTLRYVAFAYDVLYDVFYDSVNVAASCFTEFDSLTVSVITLITAAFVRSQARGSNKLTMPPRKQPSLANGKSIGIKISAKCLASGRISNNDDIHENEPVAATSRAYFLTANRSRQVR